jgi:hypothetical protein
LEQLEDRTLPSIVNLGPLQFSGPFVQAAGGGEFSAQGMTLLGLKPTQTEPLKPLLAFNGLVVVPSPTDQNQSGFSAEGQLSLFIFSDTGTTPVIWDNADGQSFSVSALTGVGQQLAPNTGPVTQDFKVAKVPLQVGSVRLDNPDGGSTEDARVGLQGELDFTSLGLTGLKAGVSGVNYALVDENGATLTGINASYNTSFSYAGVSFKGSLGATYSQVGDTFGMTGSVTITTPDNGLKDFQVTLSELTVTSGDVTALRATLNGTIQGNAIWGLQIRPNNLTFDFDFAQGHFEMFGSLSVAVGGDPGTPSEPITATMGTAADPGLATDFSGHVIDVNMGLSGSFSLFGLKLEIPSGNPLTLVYHADQNEYLISGTITAPALFHATVGLGTAAQPGLVIRDGHFSVDAFSLSLSDVPLGGFKLHQLIVAYSQADQKTTFDVTVSVAFPERWEVTGRIIIVNNAISEIALKYQATGVGSRIPIGDTGLYLTEMDGTIQNLDDIQNVVVSGHLETEFGEPVTIFGTTVTFFRAEGNFTVDADHLLLGADIWLGAKKDGGTTTGILGSGHGQLLLDWNNQKYSLTLHASMLGGVFTFDQTIYINGSLQVWASASASVNVPASIPFIGGQHLETMDFRFAYDPNDPSKQYVAAWVTVNLIITHISAGLEYKFNKNSVIAIGSNTINAISSNPFEQDTVTVYSEEFDVPAGATSATLSVNFPPNSGSQTVSITPPGGQEIKEADFNTSKNGITPLTDLNTATSYNVSIVDPSNATDPPSVPLPSGHYVMKLSSTNYKFPDTSVSIASILNDGNGNTKITFGERPAGLQVGSTIAVSGSTFTGGGSADAYNVSHVVTSISPDGMSVVTDQQYVGQAFGGAAAGWQQPEFSATFNYLPPVVTLTNPPATIPSPVLSVPVSGVIDRSFTTTTTVDLYLDTQNAGYNGTLLQRQVPLTFALDSDGKPTGKYSGIAQADVSNLATGTYYVYAVISDGTNTPVYSSYSSAFVPQHPVEGTITNQLGAPQSGWKVFADLNHDGIQEADEPVSRPTTASGQYVFASDAAPLATVSISTDSENKSASINFPTPNHNLKVGDRLLLTGSTIPAYNTTFQVTAVFPGQVHVMTDQPWVGNATNLQASLLYQANPLPSIRSISASSSTSPAFVVANFSSPQQLQVGDRFLVSGGSVSAYDTIHTVTQILSTTQVQTDQTYGGSASSLTANTLAQPIPINTPFGLVLLNPYPNNFDLGTAGLPAGWADADVGGPGKSGSASSPDGQSWTVSGGGSDIWNGSDQFNFASQAVTGDGTIVARVTSVGNTDPWAKAGVMFRDGPGAGAMFADVVVTPGSGVAFQWRSSTGGPCDMSGVAGAAPEWVKLVRAGNTFTAYYSADGNTWAQLGSARTVAMSGTAQVGLAVTAHNNTALAPATFTNVAVTGGAQWDGKNPTTVNFAVSEKAVIRGNVFADLSRDGQRVGQPLLFDFGTPTSPVAPGYKPVTAATTYTAARGFGWTSGQISDIDHGTSDPLTRDQNYTSDGTFAVDLPPGTYNVTLTLGDDTNYVHDDVGVFLQGAQVDDVTTAGGQLVNKVYTNIVVANGQLTVHLKKLGGTPYLAIEAMQIVRADDPPLAGWTVRLLDSGGAPVATTTTRSDGTYKFSQLTPGTYHVVLSLWNGAAASYDFDTVTGTAVPDTANAPNVHGGTLVNGAAVSTAAAFGIGPRPGSTDANDVLRLDGSSQFVDVMHSSNLEPGTGAFSVAGWVRFENLSRIQTIAGSLDSAAGGGWAFRLTPHSGYAAPRTFAAGSGPLTVAAADLNGDGKADLVVVNRSNTLSVLVNTTPLGAAVTSFAAPQTFATGALPQGLAVGDFNGDGKPDLASVNYNDMTVWVYLNTTAPGANTVSFAPRQSFAAGPAPVAVAVGDFNGDHKLDLAIANSTSSGTVSVLLNTTAPGSTVPSFASPVSFPAGSSPDSVAVGDFNGDGKPDLAVANNLSSGTVSVLLNSTAPGATVPSFANPVSFPAGSYPGSMAVGDFNGDGKPDLAVSNPLDVTRPVSVLLNTTASGAMSASFGPAGGIAASTQTSIAVGDFNGDGKPDIAGVSNLGTVSVYLNTTTPGAAVPSFAPSTTLPIGGSPGYMATGDFNGSGGLGFVAADFGRDDVTVVLNTLDGALLDVQLADNPTAGTGSLVVAAPASLLQTNTWYHVAFTYDPTADDNGDGSRVGTVKLYVNGALVATATGLGSLPEFPDISSASGVSFNVGSDGGDAVQTPFGGYLDDVSVWDSALTPLQVQTLDAGATSPSYQLGLLPASGTYTATVTDPHQLVEHQDFGVFQSQAVGGTIRGSNLNSYGLLDPNAQPLADWTVTARDVHGNVVATTVSQADGRYLFPRVPTGTYTIAETVPAGWKQTSPLAPKLQFANPVFYPLPAAGLAAAGDFDNDGIMDLAVAFQGRNYLRVYWGHDGGTFSASDSSQYPLLFGNPALAPVVVDVDGNGSRSLAVVDTSGGVTLLRNMESSDASRSNLFSIAATHWQLPAHVVPVGEAAGDFDRDGKTDLVVSYRGSSASDPAGFAFLPGTLATGTYHNLGSGSTVGGIAVGYLNNDPYLDVAIDGGASRQRLSVAYGDGKGGFPTISDVPGDGTIDDLQEGGPISVGDIHGTGHDDLAFASQLYSQGAVEGFFQDPATSSFPPQLNGFGVFTGESSTELQMLADLNGDLKPDLAILPFSPAPGTTQTIRVLTNNGTGSAAFDDGQAIYSTNQGALGLTAADLNGDGLADLILTTGGDLYVFLNQTTSHPQITVTLASGPGSSDNDFTNGQVEPLFGAVYDDANGNGVRDGSEPGRAGVRVYLDLADNGVFDPNRDPWTTTDSAGTYAFSEPPSGRYAVRIVPVPGRLLTDRSSLSHYVTLLNGIPSRSGSQDFGTAPALVRAIAPVTLLEGAWFSQRVVPSGAGAGRALTFSLDPGAPAAASINPATGLFTWKPTGSEGPGLYPITVRVGDAALAGFTEALPLTITVAVDATPLQPARVGDRFSQALAVGGHPGPRQFSITSGALPPGLALNPNTGLLAGIPRKPGTFHFVVTVTDSSTATGPYSAARGFTLAVQQGRPARLVFLTQPGRAPSGGWLPPIQLLVLDDFGNRLSGVVVRLALVPIVTERQASPVQGSVLRTSASNGVAIFDRVAVTTHDRYRLLASVGGIVGFSDPFNVGLDGRRLD